MQISGRCGVGPVGWPLFGVVVEATDGQVGLNSLTIPTTAASLESRGQAFALRLGGPGADLQALLQEGWIVQHGNAFSDIAL